MSANLITERRIIGLLNSALNAAATPWVDQLAMKMQSDQASETYAWLGSAPTMREWLGGRSAKDIREYSYTLANKEHEATLSVTKPELRRDKTGQLLVRINDLARRVQSYPAKLITRLMEDGEATTCYDGQYFFDTDHVEGDSATQDNDLTYVAATGTTPTVDEMRGAIMQSIIALMSFKDDSGEPMNENVQDFIVMVPKTYASQAYEATLLPTVATGGAALIPNLPGLRITPVVNNRLTWTTKFATLVADTETKPFILQEEMPMNVSAIGSGSELEFMENRHLYGVDWSGNVGYGFWQKACLTTFT